MNKQHLELKYSSYYAEYFTHLPEDLQSLAIELQNAIKKLEETLESKDYIVQKLSNKVIEEACLRISPSANHYIDIDVLKTLTQKINDTHQFINKEMSATDYQKSAQSAYGHASGTLYGLGIAMGVLFNVFFLATIVLPFVLLANGYPLAAFPTALGCAIIAASFIAAAAHLLLQYGEPQELSETMQELHDHYDHLNNTSITDKQNESDSAMTSRDRQQEATPFIPVPAPTPCL